MMESSLLVRPVWIVGIVPEQALESGCGLPELSLRGRGDSVQFGKQSRRPKYSRCIVHPSFAVAEAQRTLQSLVEHIAPRRTLMQTDMAWPEIARL